jgi:hypothetical protein
VSSADDKRVAVLRKAPTVGQKTERMSEAAISLTINADAEGTGTPERTETSSGVLLKDTAETLAVSGDASTKVRVTFDKVDRRRKERRKQTTKSSAIAGRSYIIEAKNGRIEVSEESGELASASEAKEVEKHFQSLGRPDLLLAGVPPTPLKPGDRSEPLATALTEKLTEELEGMKVLDVGVIFKERSGEDGLFDVAMKLSKEEGAMRLAVDLTGPMRLSTTSGGVTLTVDLKGPITVSTKVAPMSKAKYGGAGSMTVKLEQKTTS